MARYGRALPARLTTRAQYAAATSSEDGAPRIKGRRKGRRAQKTRQGRMNCHSRGERFLRYVVIGFVGVLLILAAVILENVSGTAPSESVWHKSFTWVSLLNELGFAFVISLIIIFGI